MKFWLILTVFLVGGCASSPYQDGCKDTLKQLNEMQSGSKASDFCYTMDLNNHRPAHHDPKP